MLKRIKARKLGTVAIASIGVGGISILASGDGKEVCRSTILFFSKACHRESTAVESIGGILLSIVTITGIFSLVKGGKN